MRYILSTCIGLLMVAGYLPDNPVEESLEDVIEEMTGLDVDLSADDVEHDCD